MDNSGMNTAIATGMPTNLACFLQAANLDMGHGWKWDWHRYCRRQLAWNLHPLPRGVVCHGLGMGIAAELDSVLAFPVFSQLTA